MCLASDKLDTSAAQVRIQLAKMSLVMRKPTFWFPTWSDTNQAVQLQKMSRGLKFWIYKVGGLYCLCSENKGADQLRGYREADLRLCFCISKTLVSHNEAQIVISEKLSSCFCSVCTTGLTVPFRLQWFHSIFWSNAEKFTCLPPPLDSELLRSRIACLTSISSKNLIADHGLLYKSSYDILKKDLDFKVQLEYTGYIQLEIV